MLEGLLLIVINAIFISASRPGGYINIGAVQDGDELFMAVFTWPIQPKKVMYPAERNNKTGYYFNESMIFCCLRNGLNDIECNAFYQVRCQQFKNEFIFSNNEECLLLLKSEITNCTMIMDGKWQNISTTISLQEAKNELPANYPLLITLEKLTSNLESKLLSSNIPQVDCDKCIPDPMCWEMDSYVFPQFYEANCCGQCGREWMQNWCTNLSFHELWHRKMRGMCFWHLQQSNKMEFTNCGKCRPASYCSGSSMYDRPGFAHNRCCARCGPEWRNAYCNMVNAVDENERKHLLANGFCESAERIDYFGLYLYYPIIVKNLNDVSYEVKESPNECAQCEPNPSCWEVHSYVNPEFYLEFCCAACGVVWRRKWCQQLNEQQLKNWQMRGFCPGKISFKKEIINNAYSKNCDSCVPNDACDFSNSKPVTLPPYYGEIKVNKTAVLHYKNLCCGNCGSTWRRNWCNHQSNYTSEQIVEYCPNEDTAIVELDDCKGCVPDIRCDGLDQSESKEFKNTYDDDCCGRCGTEWRLNLCASLEPEELRVRKNMRMCDVTPLMEIRESASKIFLNYLNKRKWIQNNAAGEKTAALEHYNESILACCKSNARNGNFICDENKWPPKINFSNLARNSIMEEIVEEIELLVLLQKEITIKCWGKQQNYTDCCLAKNIPKECLGYCNNEVNTAAAYNYCQIFLPVILYECMDQKAGVAMNYVESRSRPNFLSNILRGIGNFFEDIFVYAIYKVNSYLTSLQGKPKPTQADLIKQVSILAAEETRYP